MQTETMLGEIEEIVEVEEEPCAEGKERLGEIHFKS